VVGDDDRTAGAEGLEGFGNGGKAHSEPPPIALRSSGAGAEKARRRCTWRARMSVSRLTRSPGVRAPSVVFSSVSGISETSNQGRSSPAGDTDDTVSETP